ncbi:NAD-P-binding protein [Stereum hirsutum FP-91666 SS1]|uniref:NAD-P-binding protein n=1 Tax=Stereum hirsutum (strain FP-91666) TaxID=721885 RepID=UPI0004449CB9|nr:NAD-P-binding protein [Stereum hirsutum FP-91666 SS1]EIM81972.1 NAD-P-binding protein [Stereum hirsutum FP-91666 SS1]
MSESPATTTFTPFTGRRVALVTGSAQGIGRAIALRLASDGYSIALGDIAAKVDALRGLSAEITETFKIDLGTDAKEKEKEWEARKVVVLCVDVREESEVKEMVEKCVTELGRLDIMVANAGVSSLPQAIQDANLGDYRRVWSVNVEGAILCYKYAAIQMIKQGNGGRIIGACSMAGKKGFANLGPYSTSKFAVRALTQVSALDLAKYGITVNAYAPGVIDTPMTNFPGLGLDPLKQLLEVPNAKVGYPEDIAHWVSYVASPQSQYMTGQTTFLDGGLFFD